MLFLNAYLVACFMACEQYSLVFEKYWHMYVTVLHELKAGCMSIFACRASKPTSK